MLETTRELNHPSRIAVAILLSKKMYGIESRINKIKLSQSYMQQHSFCNRET